MSDPKPPETQAPKTQPPETLDPETLDPETSDPETQATETQDSETKGGGLPPPESDLDETRQLLTAFKSDTNARLEHIADVVNELVRVMRHKGFKRLGFVDLDSADD